MPIHTFPPDRLAELGDIYRDRNATYQDTYKNFGNVMKGFFPAALTLSTAADWNRIALFFHAADKLARYAGTFTKGGHVDSLDDLSVYSMMLQEYDAECATRIALVDVDHVVSDARWRDHMIDQVIEGKLTWDDYHQPGDMDRPFANAVAMVNALHAAGYTIVGLTSRPESRREATTLWFEKHGMHCDEMLMRPDGDHSPSPPMKMKLATARFGPELKGVEILLDDRDDVCERFRPFGILCLQVHVHRED